MKHTFVLRHLIVALSLVTAFMFALFDVPSCSMTSGGGATTLRRVDRLVAAGQFSEALPLALENRASDPRAATTWRLARVYEGLGAVGEEAAAWEAFLKESPPTGDVCLRLSDVLQKLGRPTQVIAIVNRCLALDDRQPELLGDLSAAYLEMGDRPSAVAALRRALAIDPAHLQFRAELQELGRARP